MQPLVPIWSVGFPKTALFKIKKIISLNLHFNKNQKIEFRTTINFNNYT